MVNDLNFEGNLILIRYRVEKDSKPNFMLMGVENDRSGSQGAVVVNFKLLAEPKPNKRFNRSVGY